MNPKKDLGLDELGLLKQRVAGTLRKFWTQVTSSDARLKDAVHPEHVTVVRTTLIEPILDELQTFRDSLEALVKSKRPSDSMYGDGRTFLSQLNQDIDHLMILRITKAGGQNDDHVVEFKCLADAEVKGHVGFFRQMLLEEADKENNGA
jgi:hypothetical protein